MKRKLSIFISAVIILITLILLCNFRPNSNIRPISGIVSTVRNFSQEIKKITGEMEVYKNSGQMKKYDELNIKAAFYYKILDEFLSKYNEELKQGIQVPFCIADDLKQYIILELKFIGCNLDPTGTGIQFQFQAQVNFTGEKMPHSIQTLLLDENGNAILRDYFYPSYEEVINNTYTYKCSITGFEKIENLQQMILSENNNYEDSVQNNKPETSDN